MRLSAGDSDSQVIDFLVSRYGEFVLLKPRFEWHTAGLWLLPPARVTPPTGPARHGRASARGASKQDGWGPSKSRGIAIELQVEPHPAPPATRRARPERST